MNIDKCKECSSTSLEMCLKIQCPYYMNIKRDDDKSFNEWCADCKEYDTEKHCCPRFNKVIRRTMNERINNVLDEIWKEIDSAELPKNRMSFFRDGINCALQIIDKHRVESEGTE